MARELPKTYDPKTTEGPVYEWWLEKGYFHAEVEPSRPKFSIVIPPPNVTGSLHVGHALNNSIQDIAVRRARQEGLNTLWVPGTDHAGIATQNVVERELAKEGLTRHDLGREKFLERVWAWKETYGATIINQLKRLGASCDWERERFTMDEGCSRAVRKAFVTLFEEGLIYRGKYIINWCPRCLTALSDIEVEHQEQDGNLYYIRYPLASGDGFLTVATTRPETMLGDTALAVNPHDERYRDVIGKVAILPLLGRELPIIADEYVDMEFGTGVLKVTPAHDPNDFAIGRKHHLEVINVFTEDARVNEHGGPYEGLSREEARARVVADLEVEGLLEKVEPLRHAVGHCYRCGTAIEPYLSAQWFVRMEPLAKPAIEAAREGRLRFHPERYVETYYDWLENIRDWCISRQLWWGHRIPVWYCNDCGEMAASETDLTRCPHCGSTHIHQDEDVLDTWFSSALWPFSTMGWPDDTPEMRYFYPTDLLVTSHDIIFFWVARMVMMGLKLTGKVPFPDVYIHSLVRDAQGQKMSKSKGNVIDPLVMIDKYGADALRFALVKLAVPGQNIYLSEEKIEGSRNFANKIWNASRYILMTVSDEASGAVERIESGLGLAERWILTRLAETVEEMKDRLEGYDYAAAASAFYNFFWDDFCDVYIELSKLAQYRGTRDKRVVDEVLVYVLREALTLIHPFMPFITERIYRELPAAARDAESLMIRPYPKAIPHRDTAAREAMETVLAAVSSIRSLKADVGQTNLRGFEVFVKMSEGANSDGARTMAENTDYVEALTLAGRVSMLDGDKPAGTLTAVFPGGEAYIPFSGQVDFAQLAARLEKKLAELEKARDAAERKLANPGFLAKADPDVVAQEREKKQAAEEQIVRLRRLVSELG